MKAFVVVMIFCCALVVTAQAQKEKPGRSVAREELSNSYKDSIEYAKTFKQLYALIGPQKTAYIDAQEFYNRISRTFTVQGIDTAVAHKLALTGIDNNAYEKIYYSMYREHLDLPDLKKFLEFIKTPEGMKVYLALPQLQRATTETSSYVTRTVNANLAPLRQEALQKMQKERPPVLNQKLPPGMKLDSAGHPIRRAPGVHIEEVAPHSDSSSLKQK